MARRAPDPPPDVELWRQVAATVTPLRRRVAATRAPKPEAQPEPTTRAKPAKPLAQAPAAKTAPKPAPPELSAHKVAGLDARNAQRLVRGQMAIDGKLDLHGLTQAEAHDRLSGFVKAAQARGKRTLLVITGKGYKPTGESGVLRRAVPRWLNAPDLRPLVLAIHAAQPRHGGEGALYVLLKRNLAP